MEGDKHMQIIDMHCDTLLECYLRNKSSRKNDLHIDLEKMRRAGGLLQFFAIYLISGKGAKDENITLSPYELFFDIEKLYQQQLQENRDILAPVKSFADLEKNQQSGKLSSLLTIEDAGLIEGKPERLQILYDRGVRLMTLLWNYENCIGFPQSRDEVEHRKGLKPFGVEVVERMNDIGMIVDVGHNAAGTGVVFKVVNHPIHLVEIPFGIFVLYAELIAVGLSYRPAFIGPGIPNMTVEVVNVVGLFLPYPKDFVDGGGVVYLAERHEGEFLLQVIAVDQAKFLDGVGGGAVVPFGTNLKVGVPHAVFQYIPAVFYENFISIRHIITPY